MSVCVCVCVCVCMEGVQRERERERLDSGWWWKDNNQAIFFYLGKEAEVELEAQQYLVESYKRKRNGGSKII